MIDRHSIRKRPTGWPIMYQTWGKLLFLHWPVPVEHIRPHIPAELTIDTYDNVAWVGITPFTMWHLRPVMVPALPWVSSSHEINVRTYVHHDGVPGVWFFSLDASNVLAVLGARLGFALPYYPARMSLQEQNQNIHFTSARRPTESSEAQFEAEWTRGAVLPELEPGTRDFFLIERYCLYTTRGGDLYRARIHHRPWPLCRASLSTLSSTMLEAQELPSPTQEPLIHAQADPLRVKVWPLKKV